METADAVKELAEQTRLSQWVVYTVAVELLRERMNGRPEFVVQRAKRLGIIGLSTRI
jgi:hypothetical protein